MEIQTQYKDAIRAIQLYERATGKDLPDIMNRFSVDTAFKTVAALKMTPKGKISKHDPEKKSTRRTRANTRLFYAIAAKNGWKRGQGIQQEAIRRYNRRQASRGFLKALFFKIISDYGRRTSQRPSPGGSAAKSRGIPATITRLKAEMITGLAEVTALQVVEPAFKIGLARAVHNMETYAQKKMDANAGKYSGRLL